MSAEDVIRWASGEFGERLCLTCSWQKQSSVLVHMVSELGLGIDVIELDTHLFFRESYETRDRLVERYGLNLLRPGDRDDRRAAPRRGPEPVGALSRPLLPHPQGRAAAQGARALRGLDLRHPPRPVAEPRGDAEARVVGDATASGRCTRSPTGTRSASGPTSRSTRFPTTRCTTSATGRSAAFPAPGRSHPTRRSAPAAGPARTSSNVAYTWKGRNDGAHLRARAPGVGAPPRRRLHALVHRPLGRRQDDDRAPRRARARPARPRRRVPGRRHRPHAPVEGPRLLEGGPRHEHRAHRLGRLAADAAGRRGDRGRDLAVRGDAAEGARDGRGVGHVRRGLRRRVGRRVRAARREGPVREGVQGRDQGLHGRRRPLRGAGRSRARARHRVARSRGERTPRRRQARGARARRAPR